MSFLTDDEPSTRALAAKMVSSSLDTVFDGEGGGVLNGASLIFTILRELPFELH